MADPRHTPWHLPASAHDTTRTRPACRRAPSHGRMASLSPHGVLLCWVITHQPCPGNRGSALKLDLSNSSLPCQMKHISSHHSIPSPDLWVSGHASPSVHCSLLSPSAPTPGENTALTVLATRIKISAAAPLPTYATRSPHHRYSIPPFSPLTSIQRDQPSCPLAAVDTRHRPPEPSPAYPSVARLLGRAMVGSEGAHSFRSSSCIPIADRSCVDSPTSRAPCS
jgi:hypothetical protein